MNKLYVLAVLSSFLFNSAISQDYKTVQKAIKAENQYDYEKAIKYLQQAVMADPENQYLHYKLGKNYYNQNKYDDAINEMEQAKSLMKDSMNYQFDMYHLYSVVGYNAFAKEAFIKYVNLCPSCVKADLLPGNSSNKLMYKKPIKEPELMGYESDKTEFYPYIINDNQIQLLSTKPDKSKPTNATHFQEYLTYDYSNHDFLFYNVNSYKQINKQYGNFYGPFTLNKALDKIYITRWDRRNNRMFLFFSKKDSSSGDYGWERYKTISIDIDKGDYNYIHPMLTKDEKHLMFSTNQPGGLGGYDLWIGDLTDDLTVKNVKNLGTYVNTPGDECFPTVYDNDVMFFASNGHYGFGNLDMYAGVKNKAGKIKKTYNLGNRFNSINDDYALFYNNKKNIAFFTSNRFKNSEDSMPFDRIYKQSFDKIEAKVDVIDENNISLTGINIAIPSENLNKVTDAKGQVLANVNPLGYKKIVLSGDKYQTFDTTLAPFESNIKLVARKNQPKDNISFALVSHPFENPSANTYYKITNLSDKKVYTGTTNETGIGNVTLYADEEYQIEVPERGFSKSNIKFDELTVSKFFVMNDVVAKPETPKVATVKAAEPEAPLTENFNLYYENSQWVITEAIDRQIQHIVTILSQNPSYKLELNSHTDCQGDEKMNVALSKMRMEEAKKLFFSRGVSDKQMIGKYYGESKPFNTCKCDKFDNYNCSSDEMKKNRRTEVRIIKP